MPVSNRPEAHVVEHFQPYPPTVRLGKALWQSDVCPAVDTYVGISTRVLEFDPGSSGINGRTSRRALPAFHDQAHLHFSLFTLFCGLEREMHRGVFGLVRRHQAALYWIGHA